MGMATETEIQHYCSTSTNVHHWPKHFVICVLPSCFHPPDMRRKFWLLLPAFLLKERQPPRSIWQLAWRRPERAYSSLMPICEGRGFIPRSALRMDAGCATFWPTKHPKLKRWLCYNTRRKAASIYFRPDQYRPIQLS